VISFQSYDYFNLLQNSLKFACLLKKYAAPKKAIVKKDVKSKVAAKNGYDIW